MFASIIIRTALTAAPLFAQPMHWVAGPFVPDDATRIGDDGAPQVVCRARHAAGVYPGRVVDGTCVVPHGGVEVSRPRFEVLTGSGSWENAHAGLDTAFPTGHENGRPLVLCRARHDKGVYPGRVSGGNCMVGRDGEEVAVSNFDLFHADVLSTNSETVVKLVLRNGTDSAVDVYWVDFSGNEIPCGQIAPHSQLEQSSRANHQWAFRRGRHLAASYRVEGAPLQHVGIGSAPVMVAVHAGPIWGHDDAWAKCPSVCQRRLASWTKSWRAEAERVATCDCVGFLP